MELSLKDHLCVRLYVGSRLITQAYNEELAPLGLTYPKYLVLLGLLEKEDQTVSEIGERFCLDSGTLSPLLKSLAKQGFVVRKRLESDERTVLNNITPSGKTVCRKANKIAYELFCKTGMSEKLFYNLRTQMEDFVSRCKTLIKNNKTKESVWKTIKTKRRSITSSLQSLQQ